MDFYQFTNKANWFISNVSALICNIDTTYSITIDEQYYFQTTINTIVFVRPNITFCI